MKLRIKEILKEKGISQSELADRLGISHVGLSKSLNGNPSIDRLKDIANVLNVDFTELFLPTEIKKDPIAVVMLDGKIKTFYNIAELKAYANTL